MFIELSEMGLNVKKEVAVPIQFHGKEITDQGLRIDLLIEDTLVVELKSVQQIKDIHKNSY